MHHFLTSCQMINLQISRIFFDWYVDLRFWIKEADRHYNFRYSFIYQPVYRINIKQTGIKLTFCIFEIFYQTILFVYANGQ